LKSPSAHEEGIGRSSRAELPARAGDQFRLLRSVSEDHVTPMGTTQKFVYCVCSVEGSKIARNAA